MPYNQSESLDFEKFARTTKMTYISSICPYCPSSRQITAEKMKWRIHLASHREDIIRHITDVSTHCLLCAYPVNFANKEHAASHYRCGHKKNRMLEWSIQHLPRMLGTFNTE